MLLCSKCIYICRIVNETVVVRSDIHIICPQKSHTPCSVHAFVDLRELDVPNPPQAPIPQTPNDLDV